MNYEPILQSIFQEISEKPREGRIATYIPQLANVEASRFGVVLSTVKEIDYACGDFQERFSIQSISKVFSLCHAMSFYGEGIWKRVGVEPSGNSFNSMVQLEYENGIPRNPFINAGALVVADIIVSNFDDPKGKFIRFIRELTGNDEINFNDKVAFSEKHTGYRNAALINMMKSYGNIKSDVDDVLDFYFHQCSIEMSCLELAHSFLPFANISQSPRFKQINLTSSQVKRINALMLTCGFYDESGEFTFKVGLPGKSGVGGGIVAVHPEKYSIAVWSPRLNEKGNSVRGMDLLERLTTETGTSIF